MASLIQEVTKRIPRSERAVIRRQAQRFWKLASEDFGRGLGIEELEAFSTPEKEYLSECMLSGKAFKDCYLDGGMESLRLMANLVMTSEGKACQDIYFYYSVLKLKFANQKSGARGHLALVKGENDDR
jgi:hypothetical protein